MGDEEPGSTIILRVPESVAEDLDLEVLEDFRGVGEMIQVAIDSTNTLGSLVSVAVAAGAASRQIRNVISRTRSMGGDGEVYLEAGRRRVEVPDDVDDDQLPDWVRQQLEHLGE